MMISQEPRTLIMTCNQAQKKMKKSYVSSIEKYVDNLKPEENVSYLKVRLNIFWICIEICKTINDTYLNVELCTSLYIISNILLFFLSGKKSTVEHQAWQEYF